MRLWIYFMSALWGDFALSCLGMIWVFAWLGCLVTLWNDWSIIAWVLLTIAPVGYPYDWHQRQAEKWDGRWWELYRERQQRQLAERR